MPVKKIFLAEINKIHIYIFFFLIARKITRARVLCAGSFAARNRGTIMLSLLIIVVTIVVLLPEMDRSNCSSYLLREEERNLARGERGGGGEERKGQPG